MDSKELRELRKLIEFVSESDLTEFEMEKEGLRLRLSRAAGVPVAPSAPVAAAAPAAPSAEPAAAPASAEAAPALPVVEEGLEEVRSPIVGTFYRAPRPDSSPFVEKGDRVELGQVLCIVEAMKVMNEIESEVAGEIVEVLPTNAQPVEYDEILFRVRPRG